MGDEAKHADAPLVCEQHKQALEIGVEQGLGAYDRAAAERSKGNALAEVLSENLSQGARGQLGRDHD
jgi:hypothetical protein